MGVRIIRLNPDGFAVRRDRFICPTQSNKRISEVFVGVREPGLEANRFTVFRSGLVESPLGR